MSKVVLHMEKFKMSDVGGMEMHNERKSKSSKNKEIDYSKSYMNYDFVQSHNSYKSRIKDRISQLNLKRAVRKDAVVFCSFIVSSDQEFFKYFDEYKTRKFFLDAFEFFKERYGEENIMNATIHLDESGAPHMHLGLVPVTKDGRLSAKSLFDRNELRNLQSDYADYMSQEWNIERGTKGSKAKHLDEVDFKIEKRKEELNSLNRDVENLESMKEQVSKVKEEVSILKSEKAKLQREKEVYQGELNRQKEEVYNLNNDLVSLKQEKAEMEQNIAQITPLNNQYLEVQSKFINAKEELEKTESILSKLKNYIKDLFGFAEDKELKAAKIKYNNALDKALEYFTESFVQTLYEIEEDNSYGRSQILSQEYGLQGEEFKIADDFIFAHLNLIKTKNQDNFKEEFKAYLENNQKHHRR